MLLSCVRKRRGLSVSGTGAEVDVHEHNIVAVCFSFWTPKHVIDYQISRILAYVYEKHFNQNHLKLT
jgi:hypothetical protein